MARMNMEDIPLDPGAMIDFGVVVSVDLAEARCVVRIGDPDEDDAETPPIRWCAFRAGQTRIWSAPSVGEQGILIKRDGELANAIFMPGIVCDAFPPVGNSAIDRIEFGDGSRLDYDAQAHAFEINLSGNATAKITAPGGLTIEADVTINGNVDISGTATATEDVIGGGKSLKSHKHTGVQAGGGVSGTPQ
ncbi:MAG: phage baseplate assembly protein V [Sphingomonadaceae bacterium]|nr:phage baseplate assembly protein V [Sphingomonadaceae bacterium]